MLDLVSQGNWRYGYNMLYRTGSDRINRTIELDFVQSIRSGYHRYLADPKRSLRTRCERFPFAEVHVALERAAAV